MTPDEDRSGGFEHGGWQMPHVDESAGKVVSEGMAATGGFLLGRVTYEIFNGLLASAPTDDPLAEREAVVPRGQPENSAPARHRHDLEHGRPDRDL